jgi:hypothetical protein
MAGLTDASLGRLPAFLSRAKRLTDGTLLRMEVNEEF